jgi:KDEL-tailed cysteine endopeptidase
MRLLNFIVLLSFVFAALALVDEGLTRQQHLDTVAQAKANPKSTFRSWVDRLEKAYKDDVEEFERRFAIWVDNLEFIHSYNADHKNHWLGLTPLADLSLDEYKQHALGYRADLAPSRGLQSSQFRYANTKPPANIDWREQGAVTPVKNQMQCGSCWAFSTTGSVEGINQIVTGKLVSVSEQELVDCDTTRDHGCHGGLMDFAFDWIVHNGGIDTERDYKYKAIDEQCKVDKEARYVVTIDGHEDVPAFDEASLAKAVANQPVSVAIEADQREFQLYAGGIFDAECGTQLDHGVLVVGYGSELNETAADNSTVDYWIVKNSWGPMWGDKGYIRLRRNIGNSAGQCGVAMQASYPVKTGPNPPQPSPTPPGPSPKPPKPSPPGPPEPVVCDGSNECPSGSTCCCMRELLGYCFSWACCPLPEATCCDDHMHCCPNNLPVCDTTAGRCLAQAGYGFEDSVEWSTKVPATKTADRSHHWLPHWGHNSQSQDMLEQQKPPVTVA